MVFIILFRHKNNIITKFSEFILCNILGFFIYLVIRILIPNLLKTTTMRKTLLFFGLLIAFQSNSQNQINWSAPGDVSGSSFDNNYPRIVMDQSGVPIASWSDGTNMYVSRWTGTAFSVPVTVNTVPVAGASWQGPDLASKGSTTYAVYKQTPENTSLSGVWCARSDDGGLTFGTPVRVDDIADSISRFPTVAVDDTGNPIVAFMKFSSTFAEPHWVVSKSNDLGLTFISDQEASGWSGINSEVCDCCPGQVVSEGSTVAMLYRDNNNNIRDTWAGISNDEGNTFTAGMDVDQLNWFINVCPSSGPDGVIIGDTLYSTYMNGVNNVNVFYSKSSISTMNGGAAMPLDATPGNITMQNFPRVDHHEGSIAFVWQQMNNGVQELAIQFTEDLAAGFNQSQEVVDSDNVGHVDVAMFDGTIIVVWEDDNSGTVKYRMGTYNSVANLNEMNVVQLEVRPNPSNDYWNLSSNISLGSEDVEVLNTHGQLMNVELVQNSPNTFVIDNRNLSNGVYFLRIREKGKTIKLIKQ
jgi:hypothetical protein